MAVIRKGRDPKAGSGEPGVAAIPPFASDKFFSVPMNPVRGTLLAVNDGLLPDLPLRKEKIAEKMSLFVDWTTRWTHESAELELLGLPEHNRVAYLPIGLTDKYGNKYSAIGFKGGGMPEISKKRDAYKNTTKNLGGGVVLGLERKPDALHDMEVSNLLIERGMHTMAYVAVIGLDEIRTKSGELKSIRAAIRGGTIPPKIDYCGEEQDFAPVVCLRAIRDPMRISDLTTKDIENYASSHGMSVKEYFKWWTREFATNLAILHDTGMTHSNIIYHNVTRAGELVDLNTVIKRDLIDVREDIGDALGSVSRVASITGSFTYGRHFACALDFMKAYLEKRQDLGLADRAFLLSGCFDIYRTTAALGIGYLTLSVAFNTFRGDGL